MDILEYIKQMQEIYGDKVITTADKINRPEPKREVKEIELFNEFNTRNPQADGGQLVQPNADGSRPGYQGKKNVGKDLITFKELVKLDLPYSEATLSNVFSSPDRNKNLKKLFKDNGFKVVSKGPRDTLLFNKPSAGQIDNLWQDTIKLVESGKATIPDKMRIPFKNEVLKVFNELKKTNIPFTTSDIYYKVVENVGDNKRIFIPKKLKGDTRVPGESIKNALGKDNAKLLLDGNIARIEKTTANRKKMFDLLLKGETDVMSLAKDLGISKKDVYAEANKLFDDSYRYTSNLVRKTGAGSGFGYLKNYSQSNFNTVLKNLRNSGFEKLDVRSARALIYDAYGDKKSVNYSPKKFDLALKKLKEYNTINSELRNTFGKGFQLDHTLSFKALKDLGNTTPENLIRLNPLPENINKMKVAFDRSYNNIITQLRDGNISPNISKNLLEKKKLIEDISTKTNIGSFKVDSSGKKILSFGADPFLKTDIPSQMLKNVDVQNRLVDVLKDYSDEDLKKITKKKSLKSLRNLEKIPKKEINLIKKDLLKKVDKKTSRALQSFFKKNNIKCNLANGINCGQPEAYVKSINELKAKAAAGDKKAAEQLFKVTKGLSTGGKLLRSLIGPGAILAEPVFEGIIVANKVLDGKPLDQAWAESYLSYLDPNRVDPKTLKRDEMLYRQIEGPERKVRGGKGTVRDIINIDAPGSSKLRPLFAAEDTIAAFEKAKKDKKRGEFLQRKDIENKAAANIRDLQKTGSVDFAQQRISDPATQEALSNAQEYIAAKRGAASSIAQSAQADKQRRRKAMKADGMLTIEDAKNELQGMGDYYGQGYTPFGLNKLFEEAGMQNPEYGITKVGPTTGKYNQAQGLQDYLNSMRMQLIADAGGVANLAGGGLASLTDTIPPESGPMSEGLRSLYNNDMDY